MLFLLDENVHRQLFSFLAGLGHDAACSPKGLANGAVFSLAVSKKRVLITHDKDFAEHSPVIDHVGIILLRILPNEINQLKVALKRLLADKLSPDSFANKLFIVFPDHHDELPFRTESIPF